jgi:hypothetical protein
VSNAVIESIITVFKDVSSMSLLSNETWNNIGFYVF